MALGGAQVAVGEPFGARLTGLSAETPAPPSRPAAVRPPGAAARSAAAAAVQTAR